MPKNQDSLNAELARFLKRFNPVMRGSDAKIVPVPEEAEIFQFKFVVDGHDYGTISISIDGMRKLVMYITDEVKDSPKASQHGDVTWEQLVDMVKNFALRKQLQFSLDDESNIEGDMAKREHVKKLNEGYHPMGKKASYTDAIPECKIIIKHSKVMGEGEQRFRNVERIFIENANGERFLAPTNKPGIARVYARHIAEGGQPYDERWKHLGSIVEDYTKMAGFVRATKGGQFNESTQQLVEQGVQHYLGLRESLHALTTRRGYNSYFESWTPPLLEDEVSEDLSEMFKTSSLDPRIESVMPILSKLNKTIAETKLAEMHTFEEWANDVVESSLIPKSNGQIEDLNSILSKDTLALGPDGSFAKSALEPIIHNDDLFNELERAGKEDPNGDAKEVIRNWIATQTDPKIKAISPKIKPEPMAETEEADYGDKYQDMVKRVGEKAKAQEKKKPVDMAQLAKRLNKPEKTSESLGAEQKVVGQLGPTEKISKANPTQGKLVGESDVLSHIRRLSGL